MAPFLYALRRKGAAPGSNKGANLVVMLCWMGAGSERGTAASFATHHSIAIQLPDSAPRMGPSGRSLSLKRKWLLFQLPQLSQRSR